ncbi:MAG: DUF349 domain-containing protein [Bacteroidales bacterium]|jgi:hypothetical protein|nr:DUF349 domain-containing protein [Bacteroidales bacterium]
MEEQQERKFTGNNLQATNNERIENVQKEEISIPEKELTQKEDTLQVIDTPQLEEKKEAEKEKEVNIKKTEMEKRNDNFQQKKVNDTIIVVPEKKEQTTNEEVTNKEASTEIENVEKDKETPTVVEKVEKVENMHTEVEKVEKTPTEVEKVKETDMIDEKGGDIPTEIEKVEETAIIVEKVEETDTVVEKAEETDTIDEKVEETAIIVEKVEETDTVDEKIEETAIIVEKAEETDTVVEKVETDTVVEKVEETDTVVEKAEETDTVVEKVEETDMVVKKVEGTDIVVEKTEETDTVVEKVGETDIVVEKVEKVEETDIVDEKDEETKENFAEISKKTAKYQSQAELSAREESASEEIEIADDFFDHLNRREVVETLEEIVVETDIIKVKKQISLLKIRFLKLTKEEKEERLQSFLANGGNREDFDSSADELDIRFNEAFDHYRANKAKYTEDLEQIKIINLEKKRALIEELKQLIELSTDSLKQIYDRFREIQVMWKEIGPVPQGNMVELWQNYHFYVEKFFDKVKINRELRDLDLKKNLERKLEICEKTEALLLETSIVRSFKLLQQYHQEWKESGPVEEDKKEELWNRFKTASDKINQNRKDYYDELDKQQNENYAAKLILCEKMEEIADTTIVSLTKMEAMTNQVKDLFKTWETIGLVHRDLRDAIWERFRKAGDAFFANKKQYLIKHREQQIDNYNMKLSMCMQAEALASRKDWNKATKEIIALQKEWKTTGFLMRRQSDALWNRFRKACDSFFTAKAEFFSDVRKHEIENLRKKEELIKRVNEYVFVDSREENFEALKAFQREWTAIGYTATSEKERLWNTFHDAIDKRFEELKTSVQEFDKSKYTEHINNMITKDKKEKRENNAIEREQRFLQNKIKQLTDDVNLWENNLSFFAHSKNSDELRAQFNTKIEQTKQEIAALKAKLAIVQESKKNKEPVENKNKENTGNKNKGKRKK